MAIVQETLEKICETCNTTYKIDRYNGTRQRFCSAKCRTKSPEYREYQRKYLQSHKPKRLEKICEYCSKKFEPNHGNQLRFCSNICQIKQWQRSPKWLKYCRERHRSPKYQKWLRDHRRDLRIQLMNHLGGTKCIDCHSEDYDILEIHHIYDDGMEDRKRFTSRPQFIRYYLDRPEEAKQKLEVVCGSCNRKRTRRYQ